MTRPIDVACPACLSQPGKRCTAPDNISRHEVKSEHFARLEAAEERDRQMRQGAYRD